MPTSAARTAQALHGLLEPLHTPLYFVAETRQAFEALGLEPRAQGYVAGRAAPMGAVGPGPVGAVFFNFNPALVSAALPSAWEIATPTQVIQARWEAIDSLFVRVGASRDGLDAAIELARAAVEAADLSGRPLAAGNAGLELPDAPFAALWQLLAVLREHRGDGHVALLTASGIAPVEHLVVYAAWQEQVSRRFLQRSRLWDDRAWEEAEASLRERGWLDDQGGLTAEGRAWRDALETETDRLAAAPYEAVGEPRSRRLFELLRPLAEQIVQAYGVFPRPPRLPERFEG